LKNLRSDGVHQTSPLLNEAILIDLVLGFVLTVDSVQGFDQAGVKRSGTGQDVSVVKCAIALAVRAHTDKLGVVLEFHRIGAVFLLVDPIAGLEKRTACPR
jgi:hypothetical protein